MIQTKRAFLLIFMLWVVPVFSQDEPSIHGTKKADPIFQESGYAIHGYDPVAYFTEGKARKGKAEFEYKYMGASWRFANAENRDTFAKSPLRYLPQYGGYCAYGMSHGYAAPTSPNAWTVVNDKLYLNYDIRVLREWKKDVPGLIAKADANWPKLPKKTVE